MSKSSPASPFLVIALTSLALVALEIVWTRIFSAEFYYMFAFLILSLAVSGLGLGGLALRLVPPLQEPRRLGAYLALTALLALAGPLVILHLGLEFTQVLGSWRMFGRLVLTILVLNAPFFTGGMALSLLFRHQHRAMPRLYMADLLGASAGVLGAILLMNWIGTPATTLVLVAGGLLLPRAGQLLAKPRKERAPVLFRHWDGMALIKVQGGDGYRNLNIDNTANTPINAFDGDLEALRREPADFGIDPQPIMASMAGGCRFLSLGSGGGGDVLMALRNGAGRIDAVEVNPYINRLLKPGGPFCDYSGRIYLRPEVHVHTEDARAFVRRNPGQFDLIYSLSSNTFAALASGAFALAENYLFTTEAIQDDYRALSPRGYLVMEHQFYLPRVVSEAIDGLRRAGVARPERHLAVYALPEAHRQVLVLGKAELSPAVIAGGLLGLGAGDFQKIHRLYPDPDPKANPTIARIVSLGWRAVAAEQPVDISPCTDDRPFIAQQGQWKNLRGKALKAIEPMEIRGYPLAKLLISAVLGVVLLLVLPLNLVPWLRPGPKLGGRGWGYFFAIGIGFMVLEVVLIQKYTLFIGPSAYSLVVILFTLLVASGIGSRLAPRFRPSTPFLAILAWIALECLAFGPLTRALGGLTQIPRILVTLGLIAPLGLFMGMPFPAGTRRVGELIDWGFAVNGAASVLGSAGIMLVSFRFGLQAALLVGGCAYLAALLLAQGETGWVRE